MPENITKIIERLEYYIDSRGYKFNQLATAIGVSNSYFSKMVKSKGSLGEDIIKKILLYYDDINPEWFLLGQGEMLKEEKEINTVRKLTIGSNDHLIPLYEISASAGLSKFFTDQSTQLPLEYINIPSAPKCDGALSIRGDSMYPLLKAGDIICFKTIHNFDNIRWGEMYLLDIYDGDDQYLTVKYVHKSDLGEKFIRLVSENEYHAPMDIPLSSIRAIAIVKIAIRYNTLL